METLQWVRRDSLGREIESEASETVLINGKPWTLTSVRFVQVKESVPTGDNREGGQTEA